MSLQGKNRARLAALAAAIALALPGAALAMPTEGTITEGSVTINDGDINGAGSLIPIVVSDSRINVRDNTIINWENFSIGSGERLYFQLNNHSLLNRVIGGNPSEIMGSLYSTNGSGDRGTFFLVNPNGITVGSGSDAYISGDSVILSTLNLTDDAFRSFNRDNLQQITFTTPEGRGIAAPLNVIGNADNTVTITADNLLLLVGGTVTAGNTDEALSVHIEAGGNDARDRRYSLAGVAAAREVTINNASRLADQDTRNSIVNINYAAGNTVDFGAGFVAENSSANPGDPPKDRQVTSLRLDGGTINMRPVAQYSMGEEDDAAITGGTVNLPTYNMIPSRVRITQNGQSIDPPPGPGPQPPTPGFDGRTAEAFYQSSKDATQQMLGERYFDSNVSRMEWLRMAARGIGGGQPNASMSIYGILGMLDAIDESSLADIDKYALQGAVFEAYEGTQALERTNENTTNAAIMLSNGAVYPDLAAAREAVLEGYDQPIAPPVDVEQ